MAQNYRGIDAGTGKALGGIAHLQQSIRDILTTRIGTRVMRRDYGSRLPELIDNPLNELTKTELFAATAEALERWEPRFKLGRVFIESVSDEGKVVIALEGKHLVDGELIAIEGIVL